MYATKALHVSPCNVDDLCFMLWPNRTLNDLMMGAYTENT